MIFPARPEHTYAVVVGIEKYDVGPSWDLDGPARDAVRFIAWLRNKSVPADHILAFLAPLASNQSEIEKACRDLGVEVNAPTMDVIRRTFSETLTNRAIKGDLLFTFWGGHGVVTDTKDRRLFYTDASASDKRNLVYDSVVSAGKSLSYQRFPLQISIVDACANYFEEMRMAIGITGDVIPSANQPARGIKQCVLFASSAGEVAINNNVKRAGEFSDVLINELAKSVDFPGDFEGLSSTVRNHFARLREEGKSRQTPVHYFADVPDVGAYEIGDMPETGRTLDAARRLNISIGQLRSIVTEVLKCSCVAEEAGLIAFLNRFDNEVRRAVVPLPTDKTLAIERILSAVLMRGVLPDFFQNLLMDEKDRLAVESAQQRAEDLLLVGSAAAILKEVELTAAKLRRLYLASVPDPQVAPPGETIDEMLEALVQMTPRPGSGSRIAEFLERVHRKSNTEVIKNWLAESFDAPTLEQIRAYLNTEIQVPVSRPYLAIMVRTARLRPGESSQVEAWLADSSGQNQEHWLVGCDPNEDALRGTVLEILREARDRSTFDLVVEFLVPRQQFTLAPDNWEISADEYTPASRLGHEHAVVLRWRERFSDSAKAKRQDWVRRADAIQRRSNEGLPVSWLWISKGAYNFHGLRNYLLSKADCGDCLGFEFVPDPNTDVNNQDLITAALIAGAPFLVWLRREPPEWANLQQKLEVDAELAFNDLPSKILERRRNGDLGDVTLFWDCPDHLPKPDRGTVCPQR